MFACRSRAYARGGQEGNASHHACVHVPSFTISGCGSSHSDINPRTGRRSSPQRRAQLPRPRLCHSSVVAYSCTLVHVFHRQFRSVAYIPTSYPWSTRSPPSALSPIKVLAGRHYLLCRVSPSGRSTGPTEVANLDGHHRLQTSVKLWRLFAEASLQIHRSGNCLRCQPVAALVLWR